MKERGQIWPLIGDQPILQLPDESAAHSTSSDRCSNQIETGCQDTKLDGFGSLTPRILFVGDAPMADSEKEMIQKMIIAMKLDPQTDAFVADFLGGINGWPNDAQLSEASAKLESFINKSTMLECVISLGVGGAKILYGQDTEILNVKSRWMRCPTNKKIPSMATYHPRDMIKRPESKIPAWQDLQEIIAKINS